MTFDPTTFEECWYQGPAVGNGETREFTCTEVLVGRYVAVHFPATKIEYLQLCEVEVHSDIGTVVHILQIIGQIIVDLTCCNFS